MSHIPGVSKHAEDQMAARHDYTPTRAEWLAAVLSILDRRAVLVSATMPLGREKWMVRVGHVECGVIWAREDNPMPQIITVLPHSPHINPATIRTRDAKRRGLFAGRSEPRRARNARIDLEAGE